MKSIINTGLGVWLHHPDAYPKTCAFP